MLIGEYNNVVVYNCELYICSILDKRVKIEHLISKRIHKTHCLKVLGKNVASLSLMRLF